MRRAGQVGLFLVGLLIGSSCASGDSGLADDEIQDRVVRVETSACGHASSTTGTGFVLDDGRVITAAHTVAGAGSLLVYGVGEPARTAEIVAFDRVSDLAVLEMASPASVRGSLRLGPRPAAGSAVRLALIGPDEPQLVETTVLRRVRVRIDGVRTTDLVERPGLELAERVDLGDSGAAVMDSDGMLVGVVFGRSTGGVDRTFASGVDGLDALIDSVPSPHRCDPSQHQVVAG